MEFVKTVGPLGMIFIMFSLGLNLSYKDFFEVLKKPRNLVIALVCQMVMLPLIGIIIISFFSERSRSRRKQRTACNSIFGRDGEDREREVEQPHAVDASTQVLLLCASAFYLYLGPRKSDEFGFHDGHNAFRTFPYTVYNLILLGFVGDFDPDNFDEVAVRVLLVFFILVVMIVFLVLVIGHLVIYSYEE